MSCITESQSANTTAHEKNFNINLDPIQGKQRNNSLPYRKLLPALSQNHQHDLLVAQP